MARADMPGHCFAGLRRFRRFSGGSRRRDSGGRALAALALLVALAACGRLELWPARPDAAGGGSAGGGGGLGGAGGVDGDAGSECSAAQVLVGGGHTCARKADRTLWCWGGNGEGELGDGTTTDHHTPVQVSGCP